MWGISLILFPDDTVTLKSKSIETDDDLSRVFRGLARAGRFLDDSSHRDVI
ncbi:hypothetical protein X777_00847 [Ooceraea biroi]|uniref:Uncharacterized protein n=1 Tax=Ooceraea biroi TaxID=2015173 RepID=A0A026WNW2_OOCBI|nr:hypothetical protein X777_00847 [Ooceraea biroi]